MGFLDRNSDFKDWKRWQIAAPTFIVVDYIESKAADIATALKMLLQNEHAKKYPIRFLLLERDLGDRWVDQFLSPTNDLKEAVTDTAYRPPQAGQKLAQRPLGPLDDDALWNSFAWIASEKNQHVPYHDELLDQIKNLDAHCRPFYAAVAGLAVQEQLADDPENAAIHLRGWDQAKLMEFIIHREVQHWREAQPHVDDKHANLLTLATLVGGFFNEFPWLTQENFKEDFANILPCDVVSDDQRIALAEFAGHPINDDNHWLPALEPDILGEAWVLSRLSGDKQCIINQDNHPPYQNVTNLSSDIKKIIAIAWQIGRFNMGLFCLRCVDDFPTDTGLKSLLTIMPIGESNPIPEDGNVPASDQWSAMDAWGYLVSDTAHRLVTNRQHDLSDSLLKQLNDAIQSHTSNTPNTSCQLHLALAEALYNRGITYGQSNPPQTDKAIDDYTTVINMQHATQEQKAEALCNRGIAYINLEKIAAAGCDFGQASFIVTMDQEISESTRNTATQNAAVFCHKYLADMDQVSIFLRQITELDFSHQTFIAALVGLAIISIQLQRLPVGRHLLDAALQIAEDANDDDAVQLVTEIRNAFNQIDNPPADSDQESG